MDSVRHALGVLAVVTLPPAMLFWIIVHPLARRWRRLGPGIAYLVVTVPLVGLGVALFRARDVLLGADFGTQVIPIAIGLVFYGAAAWLTLLCRRHLSLSILVGLPELSGRVPARLLQEGIYGVVRHPRYLSVALATIGIAGVVNYAGVYVLAAVTPPLLLWITVLEERELVERFGDEYLEYQRTVPRLLPRTRRRA